MLNERNSITLQGWMRTELGLKGAELITYATIWSYTQFSKESSFSEGQAFLAEWAGVDERTIRRYLDSFKEKNLISAEYTIFNTAVYKTVPYVGGQNVLSGGQNVLPTEDKMSSQYILNNILNNNNNNNSYTREDIREYIVECLKSNMSGTLLAAQQAKLTRKAEGEIEWEELHELIKNSIEHLTDQYFIKGISPEIEGKSKIRGIISQLMRNQYDDSRDKGRKDNVQPTRSIAKDILPC